MDTRRFPCAVLLIALMATTAFARKWTDASGKYSTEADLIEVKDGNVILKKSDGKVVSVALEKLSAADQEFVKSKSNAGETPQPGPAIQSVVPTPPPLQPGATSSLDARPILGQFTGKEVVWKGKALSKDEVRIAETGGKRYNVSLALCKTPAPGLTPGTVVEVRGKLSGRCLIGRDVRAGRVVDETYTVYLAEGAKAMPIRAKSTGVDGSSMYYTVQGKEVRVHNTPWGEKRYTLDFPSGAYGGTASIYVGEKLEPRIKISYNRDVGVASVTVDGKKIPRRSGP